MVTSYLVEKGLSYKTTLSSDEVRAEVGDTISDLPSSAIKSLLAINAISVVKDEPITKTPEVEPEAVEPEVTTEAVS